MTNIAAHNITESEFKKKIWIVTCVTLILPPLTGIFLLSFVGVFPFPEVLYPFTDYAGALLIISVFIGISIRNKFVKDIIKLSTLSGQEQREHIHLRRLAIYYFGILFLYFAVGMCSTLYSLSTFYNYNYPPEKYFISFLGVIPGGLITALPIFFYFTDTLGRFLAPHGTMVSVAPIKLKLIVLGLFTPLLIDTLLLMYFHDRTGYFSAETAGIWFFLMLLAAVGTFMAWQSFEQSLSPFVVALNQHDDSFSNVCITPQSLDELGMLSFRWHNLWLKVLNYEQQLSDKNIGLEHDIVQRTHELESERHLINTILESAAAIIIILDKYGNILRINPAGERITGFSLNELRNQPIWDWLIPSEQLDAVKQVFNNLAESGIDSQYENHLMKKNGERVLVTWNNSTIADESGQVQYIISIGIDISERQAAQRALEKAKETAENANVAKSEFLSRMSHELRTPMNAIIGFSQLLDIENENFTPNQKSYIKEIIQGGNLLLALINDVLELSKIEKGTLDLEMEETDAIKIITESVSLLQPQARHNNITIIDNTDKSVELIIKADSFRLKQVCINLLSNAIKYNSENGKVIIETRVEDDNLRISFRDTGPGIPLDKLDRLFKPFERLDNSYHNTIEGTGIGLALSKRLISLMEGTIGVDSQPSQGCTFYIILPFVKEIPILSSERETEMPHTDSIDTTLLTQRYRVLYVEDNPANMRLIKSALRIRPDIELLTADTGRLGLDVAFSSDPDLILLDINLPELSGTEVLKELKKNDKCRHIPIIAVSANAMPFDIESGLKAGFDNYLVKPVNIKTLLDHMSYYLPAV